MTSALGILLIFKIGVTLLAVILPFVTKPTATLAREVGLQGNSRLLQNLYVAAMFALLTNYAMGLYQLTSQSFPVGVILVGIVSNLGAASVLIYERFLSQSKAPLAGVLSIAVFGGIGVGFCVSLAWPERMMLVLF